MNTKQSEKILPPNAVGHCIADGCGIILFDDPTAIPGGWIIIFHVNVGGMCPECAVDAGHFPEEATAVLATYSPMASNGPRNHKTTGEPETAVVDEAAAVA